MSNGTDLSTSRSSPVVDFTSSDFDALKEDMISFAQAKYGDRWTDFNEDQWAVVMVDMVAYLGDLLSFQLNATARELFAATARRRQNLQNIGKSFGYVIPGPSAASVDLVLTLQPPPAGVYPFTITRQDTQFSNGSDEDEVYFHPEVDTTIAAYPVGGKVTITFLEGELYVDQLIGVSTGAPNQRWQFPQQGVLGTSISLKVGPVSWTSAFSLTDAQSGDHVYKIVQTDDGNTFAVFGDNVFGAVPPSGQEIRATFRVGGGRRGNLNPGVIKNKTQGHSNILSGTNPERSSGGENPVSMRQARNGIPAALATLDRGVTTKDYELLALKVPGVAKARSGPGNPPGARIIRLWVAPQGGGAPSSALKSAVVGSLAGKKMMTNRIRMSGPAYRNLRFHVLLHVNQNYKASEVNQAVRAGIINPEGSGLFNFAQLDFEGISTDANGNEELLIAQTRLHTYFKSLVGVGLDRAEILQLDVVPTPRARASGNAGNGTITEITLNARQRRREYFVELVSATQFRVHERIVGRVSAIEDSVLVDDDKVFENEGVDSFDDYVLAPFRDAQSFVNVAGASGQEIRIAGGASLFGLTEPNAEYYMTTRDPSVLNVGEAYWSPDGSVSFRVEAGSTPFVAGDSFTLDVFPHISDIMLRPDEYPELLEADFVTRTSGGARV